MSPVVTICTASLTFNNSTFCPIQTVFMCFVWISEQTANISLYNINWLVCITVTECVYCAVRTAPLYFRLISVFSPSTAQSATHYTFYCGQSMRDLWWKQWQSGRLFSSTSVSSVHKIPAMLCTYLSLHVTVFSWTNKRSLETFQKAVLFRNEGHWMEQYLHSS
jgi:hypothetical protein